MDEAGTQDDRNRDVRIEPYDGPAGEGLGDGVLGLPVPALHFHGLDRDGHLRWHR